MSHCPLPAPSSCCCVLRSGQGCTCPAGVGRSFPDVRSSPPGVCPGERAAGTGAQPGGREAPAGGPPGAERAGPGARSGGGVCAAAQLAAPRPVTGLTQASSRIRRAPKQLPSPFLTGGGVWGGGASEFPRPHPTPVLHPLPTPPASGVLQRPQGCPGMGACLPPPGHPGAQPGAPRWDEGLQGGTSKPGGGFSPASLALWSICPGEVILGFLLYSDCAQHQVCRPAGGPREP